MNKKMERMNELYNTDALVFLTNSLGEETGHGTIPESARKWYDNLCVPTDTLLYLVRLHGVYGVLGIYEFGEYFCDEVFRGDEAIMHGFVKSKQIELQRYLENNFEIFKKQPVLLGEESGFDECDEIAVFVPVNYEYDDVRTIFLIADRLIWKDN